MSFRATLFLVAIMTVFAMWSYTESTKPGGPFNEYSRPISTAPPCVQMYDYLETYSKKYGVPFNLAKGIAKLETGYMGPFHWSYNPKRVSSAKAYGAMQIQLPTARMVMGNHVTERDLLNDLELNVEISMKLMSQLHKRYGSWPVALGYYNTGYPVVNEYAQKIMKTK